MRNDLPIIDIYPFLFKKRVPTNLDRISISLNWVPDEHQRRLDAYTVLSAYTANLSSVVRNIKEEDNKEFGDANFVCGALASSLIGDDIRIVAPKYPEIETFFNDWASDELFFAEVAANEYKASNLGDEVYRLSWSKDKNRVKVTSFDPGFWFPQNLGKANEEHYIAWEELNPANDETEIYVQHYYREKSGKGRPVIRFTAGWYKKGRKPSFADLALVRYERDEANRELHNVDLGIDFFPIVYIPNIYRQGYDFGESDLTGVWQVLDSLTNTYTDQSKNTDFMGLVQMYVELATFDKIPILTDGTKKIQMGEGNVIPGKAGIVDNSTINKALTDHQHELETKLYTNTMLGSLGTGAKTGSGDRTTGIFMMKGGPLERFIWTKRLMRQPKYDRLLKFVARFTLLFGDPDSKKLFKGRGKTDLTKVAHIQFGNILPIDQTALIDNVQKIITVLSDNDLKDNLKEAGLVINEDIERQPIQAAPVTPAVPTTTESPVKPGIVSKQTKQQKTVQGA